MLPQDAGLKLQPAKVISWQRLLFWCNFSYWADKERRISSEWDEALLSLMRTAAVNTHSPVTQKSVETVIHFGLFTFVKCVKPSDHPCALLPHLILG